MNKLKVAVIMGSDSDLPIVKEAIDVLTEFKVNHEVLILSAHRSPKETSRYATNAAKKGIQVIIAAAGGAAHLPGVIAAYTTLPIIGIPIKTNTLNGLDSLYSIVQMPSGVPVATVAINGAKNAALLALEILAVSDPQLKQALVSYKRKLARTIKAKSKKLNQLGIKAYLKLMEQNQ